MTAFSEGLTPIAEAVGFGASVAEFKDGNLLLGFTRTYPEKPQVLNLNFAYGRSAEVSYHASRGCFQLKDIPACPAFACPTCPVCRFNFDGESTPTPDMDGESTPAP